MPGSGSSKKASNMPIATHAKRKRGSSGYAPTTRRVRDLNDGFRTHGLGRGTVLVMEGISALGPEFVTQAVSAVRRFVDFTEDDDPSGEHDFGVVELDDQKIFRKIDSYDLDLTAHSSNPANPAVTHLVLTIMLAREC